MKKPKSALPVVLISALTPLASGCWSYTSSGDQNAVGGTAGVGNGGTSSGGTSSGGNPLCPPVGVPSGAGAGPITSDTLPCDVLEGAGHPCVSAHSTIRKLVRAYNGPLYQVQRSDQETLNIGTVDGYADVAAQEAFCGPGGCTVPVIYDQAPFGNHLTIAPPGSNNPLTAKPAVIGNLPVTVNGRQLYGLKFRPGQGYRAACDICPYPQGPACTAVGDEPETMYMVSSQHDLINGCCFDYGNAEWTRNNDGNGTMEALYLGLGVVWGSGVGPGPWLMADMENGLFPGWENNQWDGISTALSLNHDFIMGVLVGDTREKNEGRGRFALYAGDATAGELRTQYDGIRPTTTGYVPMVKQGSVILSIGGDNSDGDGGRFYEGVMANGAATKETVDRLQAAIVAAGYGR